MSAASIVVHSVWCAAAAVAALRAYIEELSQGAGDDANALATNGERAEQLLCQRARGSDHAIQGAEHDVDLLLAQQRCHLHAEHLLTSSLRFARHRQHIRARS